MIVLESIIPIFSLIGLGALLPRLHLTDPHFLKTLDRLIYYLFFPVLLFYKIGGSSGTPDFNVPLLFAVSAAILFVYFISLICAWGIRMPAFHVGAFSQCCYRFNTYVGMAVVLMALGDQAVRDFSILIGLMIPYINVLAVSTLIWFSGSVPTFKARLGLLVRATFSNPLILACAAGMAYSLLGIPLPGVVDNTLHLLSMVTLPMALIAVGGSLHLQGSEGRLYWALLATGCKHLIFPVAGFVFLNLFHVSGPAFQMGMIFFALPTSVAAYILSAQMGSDADLAAQIIFLSTLSSILSLSAVLWLFV